MQNVLNIYVFDLMFRDLSHRGQQHRQCNLAKVLTGKEPVITFKVKLEPMLMQPVHHASTLVGRDGLARYNFSVVLNVCAVGANHAVKAQSSEFGRNLGLATAGTEKTVCPAARAAAMARLADAGMASS